MNDKNVDMLKFKAFADEYFTVAQMMELVFNRVENIVGKGGNPGLSASTSRS